LSRVVGILSRIHSENEIHKVIIAKLATRERLVPLVSD
jgi:hypothetical protein